METTLKHKQPTMNPKLTLRRLRKALKDIRFVEAAECYRFADSGVFEVQERGRGKKKVWILLVRCYLSGPPVPVATFQVKEAAMFFLWAASFLKPLLWLGESLVSWIDPKSLTSQQDYYLREWEISNCGGWQREMRELQNKKKG